MVLGKATFNLDDSRSNAYGACSRCGWGLFGDFFPLYPFSSLSPSLLQTARYRLKYCLKEPLNPKQPTNQSIDYGTGISLRIDIKAVLSLIKYLYSVH